MKLTINCDELTLFFIIFARVFAALLFVPGFGDNSISAQIRLYVALFLAILFEPLIAEKVMVGSFTFAILWREALVGVFAGVMVRFVTVAVEVCGNIIAAQSGLSFASFFSAIFHENAPIYTLIFSLAGSLLFFVLDFHIIFLKMIIATYAKTNFFGGDGGMIKLLAHTLGESFRFGVVLAFPFITAQIAVLISVGLTNKFTPQTQLFFIMHPFQILMAFVVITITIVSILHMFTEYFNEFLIKLF